ncbi:MAG: hypothetical protein H0U92_14775 [Actinobacteria bacterium]|nr:hypothetical protein [Actinomycetota bacterium]
MKLIRLLAAAGVAALVLLAVPGAGPALAANEVNINSPSDIAYTSYPALSGAVSQSGSNATVTKVDLALTSVDGWTSENATLTYTSGAQNSSAFSGSGSNVSFSWTQEPNYNGRYTFTVNGTGTYNGGLGGTRTETGRSTRSFDIEVAPAKPSGVAAGMPENSTQVTVTWNPNPEPDIAFYQVLRSYAGGNPATVGSPVGPSSKPTFHDDLSGKAQGAYKYSVQAVRRARTCKTESSDEACSRGIPGPISAQSAAVTVRATPASTTTSTTIKGSTGAGTTGGGSTGGGSTGGGTTGGSTRTTTPGGKSAPRNTGGYAPGGNVDLSQFGALLGGNGKPTNSGAVNEGTYDPDLKYNPSEQPAESGGGDSLITIGGASVPAPSEDWVRFIGAGSLATALLVHVLWFKQQVDRIPLEAITE